MSQLVILVLRGLLVLIALGAVGLQVVLAVVIATQLAAPDTVILAVAYSAFGIAAVACVEVLLAALWVLLSMVRRDAIFDERAFRWVDVISVAGLVAAVLVAGLCAHAGEVDDAPGLVLIGGGIGLSGVAFALLMVVMRGLLRSATVLRRELDEVV
ncbi:DUF2975 domain-containing protein [Pseudonocardia kunmingensis]|uniref:DUF2975 family protein n=1 Tax=Pseudonocardia kunmingensis TaxID=630975 RepID=A0A543DZK5_9PSEU|nr:DUF2975 domain-containing protein [Pseudonocardia kunmingensis]TQM14770.1 DUF2975 family protein [Pseudonocardia kunmingensis]